MVEREEDLEEPENISDEGISGVHPKQFNDPSTMRTANGE